MTLDATFWVAISFFMFFGILIYFKIPQSINSLLGKMIEDIKNEIEESEKLRTESKDLLDKAQKKLNTANEEGKKIIENAKKASEKIVIEMNEKFHKSAEIKKNSTQLKINQMKEAALKDIRQSSIKIAVDSVEKIISSSIDKDKLDKLFNKDLNEAKEYLKKINL